MSTHFVARPVGPQSSRWVRSKEVAVNVMLEELPEDQQQLVERLTEDFQKKCLESYGKTRGKVVQKFALPAIKVTGQRDEEEEQEKQFVVDTINKWINQALTNHNIVFLNTFRNVLSDGWCAGTANRTCILQCESIGY